MSTLQNSNNRWIGHLEYHYEYAGGVTDIQKIGVNPGYNGPIGAFGIDHSSIPTNIRLIVDSLTWERIDDHDVPSVEAELLARGDLNIQEFTFTSAADSPELSQSRLLFDLHNDTAYSFWRVDTMIELFQGSQRVGVIPLTLENFERGNVENIDFRVPDARLRITDIEIHLLTNLFDEDSFKKPGQ